MTIGDCMAEGEGFEPPGPFRAQRFSRPPVSTTHPPLRLPLYLARARGAHRSGGGSDGRESRGKERNSRVLALRLSFASRQMALRRVSYRSGDTHFRLFA